MNPQEATPIGVLAAMLGVMTERAQAAERERDAALRDSEIWRASWQRKENEVKELQAQLKAKGTKKKGESENA